VAQRGLGAAGSSSQPCLYKSASARSLRPRKSNIHWSAAAICPPTPCEMRRLPRCYRGWLHPEKSCFFSITRAWGRVSPAPPKPGNICSVAVRVPRPDNSRVLWDGSRRAKAGRIAVSTTGQHPSAQPGYVKRWGFFLSSWDPGMSVSASSLVTEESGCNACVEQGDEILEQREIPKELERLASPPPRLHNN
jgi:hypothetical protein